MVGSALSDRFAVVVPHLFEIGIRVLESRARKNPVQVRMRELAHITAADACAARWVRSGAKQSLGEPERQSLLSNPALPVKEEAAGKGSSCHAFRQPSAQCIVTIEFNYRHVEIWQAKRRQAESGCWHRF